VTPSVRRFRFSKNHERTKRVRLRKSNRREYWSADPRWTVFDSLDKLLRSTRSHRDHPHRPQEEGVIKGGPPR